MSKVAYRPLTVLVRAQTSDSRLSSNSAKVLCAAATFVAVFALLGVVAICSNGISAFSPGTFRPKGSAGVPVFPTTKVSTATPTDQDNGIGRLSQDAYQAHQGTIESDHSIIEQTPAPALNPTPSPASVEQPESKVSASDGPLLERERPDTARKDLERELPKAVRKKLEKERREAERKRSRLEEMYQQHALSSEVYKKGVEKYKSEIERYRREMNPDGEPKNEPAF